MEPRLLYHFFPTQQILCKIQATRIGFSKSSGNAGFLHPDSTYTVTLNFKNVRQRQSDFLLPTHFINLPRLWTVELP